MRNLIAAAAVSAVLAPWPCLNGLTRAAASPSAQDRPLRSTDDTTFYRVPLMCKAARGLGCGSRARPVLLELQQKPAVQEAWLNQTGDILAVVWKPGSRAVERQSAVAAVAEAHGVSVDELDAAARDAALTSFQAGTGWHRGTDVDQLSAQEARVIANRLLHRVVTTTPSVQPRIAIVEPTLTNTILQLLVSGCTSPQRCKDSLLTAARPHLRTSELAALKDAIERGFTPLGNEQ